MRSKDLVPPTHCSNLVPRVLSPLVNGEWSADYGLRGAEKNVMRSMKCGLWIAEYGVRKVWM